MAGDLTQILLSAQDGSNAQARQAAEAAIHQAEASSLEQYIGALMQEMANPEKPPQARHMAGLLIKKTMTARSKEKRDQQAQKWLAASDQIRGQVKVMVLQTLGSPDRDVSRTAAMLAANLARIELPQNQWQNFCTEICGAASPEQTAQPQLREGALACLGFVCEETDASELLRNSLAPHAAAILSCVCSAMRKEEPNPEIRHEGTRALLAALEFIGNAMEHERERNHIMQVICECASAKLTAKVETRELAMQSLVKICALYYDKLGQYMQFIFTLTIESIKNDAEGVAMQGIEFWSTLAEVEAELSEPGASESHGYPCTYFVKGAAQWLTECMWICLQKQDEHAASGEWNLSAAAATCMQQISTCIADTLVTHALPLIQQNIANPNWRQLEAATMLFGCILEGSSTDGPLSAVWSSAVPTLLRHFDNPHPAVRDTAVWAIGRMAECHVQVVLHDQMMGPVLTKVLEALGSSEPRIAAKACYAILHTAGGCGEITDDAPPTNKLSPYFSVLAESLVKTVDRPDASNDHLRLSAWEALNALTAGAAIDTFPVLQSMVDPMVQRLQATVPMMQTQDRAQLQQIAEVQGLVCGALNFIARKLGGEGMSKRGADGTAIADRIMNTFGVLVQQSNAVHQATGNMMVQQEVIMAIGSIAAALESNFTQYLGTFAPYLLESLKDVNSPQSYQIAVGCLAEILSAVKGHILPYCDQFVTALISCLGSPDVSQDSKPVSIAVFGDMALHIGGEFERYLQPVMPIIANALASCADQVKQQGPHPPEETLEFQSQLQVASAEAYIGIVQGMGAKRNEFSPYCSHLLTFIGNVCSMDQVSRMKEQDLIKRTLELIGDLVGLYGAETAKVLVQGVPNNGVHTLCTQGLQTQDDAVRDAAEYAMDRLKKAIH